MTRARLLSLPALAAVLAASAACVTIKVYFPAARIQQLSEQIEAEVQRPEEQAPQAAPDAEAPEGGAESRPREETPEPKLAPAPGARGSWDALFGVEVAHAAEDVPPPSVTSPAIRKIIESRRERLPQLRRFKDAGAIGESNQALVEVRAAESVADLAQRAEMQKLVRQENDDRELLFREIAASEGVSVSQLPRIRETYATTLRSYAQPGDLIQLPDGTWTRKE